MQSHDSMLSRTPVVHSEHQDDEREFVISLKEQYIQHLSKVNHTPQETVLDVVKLDFERLADFIRFEALKQKKLLTIDRIKTILTAES